VLPHLTTGRFGLANILNIPLTEVEACPDGYREERTLLSPHSSFLSHHFSFLTPHSSGYHKDTTTDRGLSIGSC
jgi:hypothetical protein